MGSRRINDQYKLEAALRVWVSQLPLDNKGFGCEASWTSHSDSLILIIYFHAARYQHSSAITDKPATRLKVSQGQHA